MRLESKILNVKRFEFDDFLIVLRKNDIFIDSNEKALSIDINSVYDFVKLGNNIILSSINPESTYEYRHKLKLPFILHLGGIKYENSFYCLSDYNNEKGYIEIKYDLSVKRFWKLPFGINGIKKIHKDEFYSSKKNFLTCHNLSTGTERWRIDVSETGKWIEDNGTVHLGSINKIEVFESTIVLLLGNDVLLGLDVTTGQIKWQRAMPVRILTPAAFHKGKIYWFSLGDKPVYHIIDMPTGNIDSTLAPPDKIKQRLTFTQPFVSDDLIMMTSVSTHEIFTLNKHTLNIEDITKLESCQNRVPIDNSPQLHGNHLYQLDGDNTLHIFERQEDQLN